MDLYSHVKVGTIVVVLRPHGDGGPSVPQHMASGAPTESTY